MLVHTILNGISNDTRKLHGTHCVANYPDSIACSQPSHAATQAGSQVNEAIEKRIILMWVHWNVIRRMRCR